MSGEGIRERQVSLWRALYNLKIWTSSLIKGLKTGIFVAAIELILLFNREAWTITAAHTNA